MVEPCLMNRLGILGRRLFVRMLRPNARFLLYRRSSCQYIFPMLHILSICGVEEEEKKKDLLSPTPRPVFSIASPALINASPAYWPTLRVPASTKPSTLFQRMFCTKFILSVSLPDFSVRSLYWFSSVVGVSLCEMDIVNNSKARFFSSKVSGN